MSISKIRIFLLTLWQNGFRLQNHLYHTEVCYLSKRLIMIDSYTWKQMWFSSWWEKIHILNFLITRFCGLMLNFSREFSKAEVSEFKSSISIWEYPHISMKLKPFDDKLTLWKSSVLKLILVAFRISIILSRNQKLQMKLKASLMNIEHHLTKNLTFPYFSWWIKWLMNPYVSCRKSNSITTVLLSTFFHKRRKIWMSFDFL